MLLSLQVINNQNISQHYNLQQDGLDERIVVVQRVNVTLDNLTHGVDCRNKVLNLRGEQYLQKSCDIERCRTQRPINLDSQVNLISCSNLTQVHNSLS